MLYFFILLHQVNLLQVPIHLAASKINLNCEIQSQSPPPTTTIPQALLLACIGILEVSHSPCTQEVH